MKLRELLTPNTPPKGWPLRVVILIAVLGYALSIVGELIQSQVIDRSPITLVALNPTNKNLILVNGDEFKVAATPYYIVGFFRHIATDPAYYLLGLWFGDRAIEWVSRVFKSFGKIFEEGDTTIRWFVSVLVFMSPVSLVCALAGATKMKFKHFIVLDALGTVASLVLIRWLGDRFGGGIDRIVNFVVEYRWQVLAASALYIGFVLFRDFKSDSGSEIAFLKKLRK